MTATIRTAATTDVEALVALHTDCWDDAYTGLVPDEVLADFRASAPTRIERWAGIVARGDTVVAEDGGGLVGFATAGPEREDGPTGFELYAIYTRARVWGTGVGHALLERALGDRPAMLWVLEGNDRAIGFYERHGFRRDGHTEVVPEGVDVRMVRNPPAPAAVDPA